MNKYYIRFNPIYCKLPGQAKPWVVIEITEPDRVEKIFLNSLNIEVPTWTEESKEDNNFWNIACNGILHIENSHGVISAEL